MKKHHWEKGGVQLQGSVIRSASELDSIVRPKYNWHIRCYSVTKSSIFGTNPYLWTDLKHLFRSIKQTIGTYPWQMTGDFVPFQMHFSNTFTLFAICIPSEVTDIIDFLVCVGVVGVYIDLIWFDLSWICCDIYSKRNSWLESRIMAKILPYFSEAKLIYMVGWLELEIIDYYMWEHKLEFYQHLFFREMPDTRTNCKSALCTCTCTAHTHEKHCIYLSIIVNSHASQWVPWFTECAIL